MDKLTDSDRDQLERAVERLREHGLAVRVWNGAKGKGRGTVEPRVRLTFGGQQSDYAIALRRGLRAASLGATLHGLEREDDPVLLVCDHVALPLAETLREREQHFVDTAGNVYLNAPPLLLWVAGRKLTTPRQVGRKRGRAFQSKGLQVVFALLCHPEWARLAYRELARVAGVAHGSVGAVLEELREQGFVDEIQGERSLLQRGRLLTRWAEAYARVLRPTLVIARYRAADLARVADARKRPNGVLLGGEIAAARWTRELQAGSAVVYGAPPDPNVLATWRLSPDPEGNVEFLRRFWEFEGGEPGFAPAPLVYADLLATGDERCLIAARELHERIEARAL